MYCTKCGKEIADDSRFCTACGNAINKTMSSPISETPPPTPKRKIRTSWIVIGIIIVILIIAILVDRNSPENKAARLEREQATIEKSAEKQVTWGDVKKSWAEAKKAKQDLDKSVGELKSEWNGFKKQVKDAVNGGDGQNESTKREVDVAVDELKEAVKETKKVVEKTLNDKDLQDAANELKAALQD